MEGEGCTGSMGGMAEPPGTRGLDAVLVCGALSQLLACHDPDAIPFLTWVFGFEHFTAL